MFIDFSINRELSFKFENTYFYSRRGFENNFLSFGSFESIKFSKPKSFEFSSNFFPFLVLSNGSLIFVEFAFNKFDRGTLLFDDLY